MIYLVLSAFMNATILLLLTLFLPGIKNEGFSNTVILAVIVSILDTIVLIFLAFIGLGGAIGFLILIPVNAGIFMYVGEILSVSFEDFQSALVCSGAYSLIRFGVSFLFAG